MADTAQPRKLATIVALDVAGYSARTEADEAKTTAEVAALRPVIETIAARHSGRVFNTAGDGFMLEFASSLEAVEAAIELAESCEPKVRVGVHLGDVVVQPNGDLLGHGVNVAARLMAKSDPGSALVSGAVRQTIRGPLADRLVSRGLLHLDKMAETIEAFAIGAAASPAPRPAINLTKLTQNRLQLGALAVGALAIIAALVAFSWRANSPTAAAEKSIAILPFKDRSQVKIDAEYGDWLSELISSLLGKARDLKVISQTSASAFKGKDVKLPDIGRQLGVALVLEGSVRSEGDNVTIKAQLVNAATDAPLWNDTYERANGNAPAVQSEVAAKVATAVANTLQVALAQSERQALTPGTSQEAFDTYLEAAKLYRKPSEPSARKAQLLLDKAVELDPKFAPAWALLARAHAYLFFNRSDATEGRRAAAAQALDRAKALNPTLTEVLLADAYFDFWVERDYDGARRRFEELSTKWPSNADVLSALASIARRQGRWESSKEYFARIVEIDPLHPSRRLHAANVSFAMRDFDGALKRLDAALVTWPKPPDSLPFIAKKAEIFQAQGRLEDAAKALEGFAPDLDDDLVTPVITQAMLTRRPAPAIALLEKLLNQIDVQNAAGRTSIDLNIALAELRRLAGDANGAARNARRALAELEVQVAKQPDSADILSYLALAYASLRDRANAIKYANLAVQTVPVTKDALSGSYYLDVQARVLSRFGDRNAIPAIEAMLKLAAPTPLTQAHLRLDPTFDKLRTDPRFKALAGEAD